jgi:hypothetical protein
VLEGEASHGIEEEGEVARRGHEGGDGAQGSDEVLIEVFRVTDDAAVVEDGLAAVVRIVGEMEARVPADAGEDGGAQERDLFALEGGGGGEAGLLLEALALAEDGPADLRIAFEVPGAETRQQSTVPPTVRRGNSLARTAPSEARAGTVHGMRCSVRSAEGNSARVGLLHGSARCCSACV